MTPADIRSIRTIRDGDELLAARASLGCLGVILELTLELVPRFWMEECMKVHDSLESVLAEEAEWPQQQFLVFPYGWQWYAYQRRTVPEPNARALRRLRWVQAYDVLVVEWGLHALVKTVLGTARLFGARPVTAFWKQLLPPVMRPTPVSGSSEAIFTLHTRHHHIYRHVEMELFVPKPHLTAAAAFLQEAIPFFAGVNTVASAGLGEDLARAGLLDEFTALRGQYVHHYLIFFRRVLGEETYLAMNEGGERVLNQLLHLRAGTPTAEVLRGVRIPGEGVCTALLGATALGEVQPADGCGDRTAISGTGALSRHLPSA